MMGSPTTSAPPAARRASTRIRRNSSARAPKARARATSSARFIAAVKITIQFFDGCPHWELAERRLRKALADIGREDVQITQQRIDSPEDAQRLDFHGSPTFLVNGRDPFAAGEAPASLGCNQDNDPMAQAMAEAQFQMIG